MRTKAEIEKKLEEIEQKVIEIRDIPKEKRSLELNDKHWELTEQMAVLRWVVGFDYEWNEPGIKDT